MEDEKGLTPLHRAAQPMRLLEAGAEVGVPGGGQKDQFAVLDLVYQRGHEGVVDFLYQAGKSFGKEARRIGK